MTLQKTSKTSKSSFLIDVLTGFPKSTKKVLFFVSKKGYF